MSRSTEPIAAHPAAHPAIHVVLVHPEIHWNTGNAGRTCLATGATLHLIEPLGFTLDEREVKRAGLDYWEHVDLRTWPSWQAFEAALPSLGTPWLLDEHASTAYWDAPLGADTDVVLIFGRENGGFPRQLLEQYDAQRVRIPMRGVCDAGGRNDAGSATNVGTSSDAVVRDAPVRSLNLSTSVALAVYEVLRQRSVR